MIITEIQRATMLQAAIPLMQWLRINCHPHCTVHVGQVMVELTEGIASNSPAPQKGDLL